ncbi:TonB-dependent receptor [Galbibacter sp. BG1]|uniref:SusC/RagA family TonB-linked outer membrane protein n=1 Tax=Galbibacter sp. BG1 TaxID=1170699 RepID=UPI0015BBFE3B|nr:TonB-dependent receptor [Galbibacter sp. BG1]QLE01960.1 TonB-dependent receptor [Galbibacter sp. BG1]
MKKNFLFNYLFILLFLVCGSFGFAQTVSGTVTDASGTPLPGTSVLVKGTSNGTQTDFDGNYSISVDGNSTLVFSYVGFETKEVSVNNQSTVNVSLNEAASALDEVVVIGYGSKSKASVTSSISSVSSEELVETPSIGVQQALQGRAAGVQVTNAGTPGSNPLVTIRGLGTFGNNSPLFVVDGVPTGGLNNVPVESIESVDILKDAASAAIYGSRGSNGVVLITTKGGRAGKAKLSFSTYSGFATNTKTLDVLNADQYREYALEYDSNPNEPGNQLPPGLQSGNYDPSVDTDWQDELFRTGLVQNYVLQVAGGAENVTYNVRSGYLKQEGTLINTDFERYNLGVNTSVDVTDRLTIGETLNLSYSLKNNEQGAGGSSVLVNAIRFDPTRPVFDQSTNFYSELTTSFNGQDAENPVRILENSTSISTETSVIASLFANYEIIDGLTYRITFGLDHSYNNFDGFTKSIPTGSRANENAFTSKSRNKYLGTVFTNTLNYVKTINDVHNVDVLVGYEWNQGDFDGVNSTTANPLSDFVENLNVNDVRNLSSFSSANNLESYFGRVSYDFDKKFLLSATVRRDGSSRFGPDNRWANFPSASAGINLGRIFMEDNDKVSDLKLRGSWGISGNNNIGDYLYDFGLQTNFNYVINDELVSGTRPTRLANPGLKWEELESIDIGIDIGLWNNAFTFSADYFSNKSDGLLVGVPTPASSGDQAGFQVQNVGGTETTGFEFNLAYNDYVGDFTWGTNVNFGTLDSEVTSLGEVEAIFNGNYFQQNHNRLVVGEPLLHFFGYRTDGIFQNQAEVDAHATQNNAQPGNVRYVDTNNDGAITGDDRVIIGNPTPEITANVSFNFNYKNFDASIFFNGVYGNEIYNGNRYNLEQQSRLFNMGTTVLDRWTPTNPSNTVPKATPGFTGNELVSDRFIEDGSYTRLRSATIGYSIPQDALKQISNNVLSKLRIYLSGENIFTWTDYSGYNPEISPGRSGGTVTSLGLDRGNYPQPRTVLAGLQFEF